MKGFSRSKEEPSFLGADQQNTTFRERKVEGQLGETIVVG